MRRFKTYNPMIIDKLKDEPSELDLDNTEYDGWTVEIDEEYIDSDYDY